MYILQSNCNFFSFWKQMVHQDHFHLRDQMAKFPENIVQIFKIYLSHLYNPKAVQFILGYSNMIIELALPVSSHLHRSCMVLDVWHQYRDNDWPVQRGQWAESQVCAYASCIPSSSSHPPPTMRQIPNLKPEQLYLIVTVTIF